AARPARGFRRSARARKCACSRRATCWQLRRAEARGRTIYDGGCVFGGRRGCALTIFCEVLSGRLYRAALLPIPFALAIAALSFASRPQPLTSSLAPDAFEGARAFAEMNTLAREYPRRRPGSRGDRLLAAHVARDLEGLGGTAGGGFTVRTRSFSAQTIDGRRALTAVIAERPGATGATPIPNLAHRDP